MGLIAAGLMAASTAVSVAGSLAQGKAAEKIGKARARADEMNAAAAAKRARSLADIKLSEGEQLLARQRTSFAKSGVRVGAGSPATVAAQTRADIMKDVGFILEGGAVEQSGFLNRAQLERATGKHYRSQSKWDALNRGLGGGSSIAFLGFEQGWWGDKNQPGTWEGLA
jgi:hypothetical protein